MSQEYLQSFCGAMDKIMGTFDHDKTLEYDRTRNDHAERPEPVEPEFGSEEWTSCLGQAADDVFDEYGVEIAMEILDHGKVSDYFKNILQERLAAELQKRAK